MKKAFSVIIIFAVVLSLALAACTDNNTNKPGTTAPGTTVPTTAATTGATTAGTTAPTTAATTGATTAGTTAGTSAATTGPTGTSTAATAPAADASFMFNKAVYKVGSETADTADVGIQLMSVLAEVTGTPAKDGEAKGLAQGTKVYQMKSDTKNETVLVEYNSKYYKATKK